jgi:hypothetical protein
MSIQEARNMRNLLALLGLVLVIFGGMGWYLDWYKAKSTPAADGHRSINVDVNTPKITKDLNKAKEKVRDFLTKDDDDKNPPAPGVIPVPGVPTSTTPGTTPTGGNPFGTAPTTYFTPDGVTFTLPPVTLPLPPSEKFPKLPSPN